MAKSKQAEPKPPADHHGPQGPVEVKPHGVAHLRRVLELSASVSVEDLCEEAALRIEQAPEPTTAWPDKDARRRENLASML